MKILLLNPINRSYVIMPSVGLGYLAAMLTANGHFVEVVNSIKEGWSYDEFSAYLGRHHYDAVGFQVYSYDLDSVKRMLTIVRTRMPQAVTIAGGAHPSGDPVGTLNYLEQLDFAFQGEAEIGLPMLVDCLARGEKQYDTIPGLVRRENGDVVVNPRGMVHDLDQLPFPAWELLKPEEYPEAPHGAFTRRFPTAPIVITRGCPCGCTFCAGHKITGRKIRRRSLENVISELRCLAGRGIREFHIEDENFTASRDFVLEFCRRLDAEQMDLSWSLPAGVCLDSLDREMLAAMAQAGCYSIAVGIEFGSDRMHLLTGTGLTVETIHRQMSCFAGSEIKVTGFFLLGFPDETPEEMEQTIALSLQLPLDKAQFNNFMPLPGSVVWEELRQENRLANIDWNRFFVNDVSYVENGISREQMKKLQRRAVLRFYARPRVVAGLLGEIRSFRHLFYIFRRLADTLQ